jgi:hypothetical protein
MFDFIHFRSARGELVWNLDMNHLDHIEKEYLATWET